MSINREKIKGLDSHWLELAVLSEEYRAALLGTAGLKTNFTIYMKPVSISFECPYCDNEVNIAWDDLLAFEYRLNNRNDVKCPHCKVIVFLDDYKVENITTLFEK